MISLTTSCEGALSVVVCAHGAVSVKCSSNFCSVSPREQWLQQLRGTVSDLPGLSDLVSRFTSSPVWSTFVGGKVGLSRTVLRKNWSKLSILLRPSLCFQQNRKQNLLNGELSIYVDIKTQQYLMYARERKLQATLVEEDSQTELTPWNTMQITYNWDLLKRKLSVLLMHSRRSSGVERSLGA